MHVKVNTIFYVLFRDAVLMGSLWHGLSNYFNFHKAYLRDRFLQIFNYDFKLS